MFSLINSECRACFADFCLVAIVEEASSISDGPSADKAAGTIRWMAPEILDPERYGYVRRARRKLPFKNTDIYALGITTLEACTKITAQLRLLCNLDFPQRVITGRRPFE